MGLRSKTLLAGSAALGLAITSQAPEFAQQYRQRLGGALDELRVIIADFDRDAGNSGMDRAGALAEMQAAPGRFIRDRGASMAAAVSRLEALEAQQKRLDQASALEAPLIVMSDPDPRILAGAWSIFVPALPLSAAGAAWGGAGAAVAWLLARLGIGASRANAKRREKRHWLRIARDARNGPQNL